MNQSKLITSNGAGEISNLLRDSPVEKGAHSADPVSQPLLSEILCHPNDPSEWEATLTEIESYVRFVLALYAGGCDNAESVYHVMAFRNHVLSALGHFHYEHTSEDEFDFELRGDNKQHKETIRFTIKDGTLSVYDTYFMNDPSAWETDVRLKWNAKTDRSATGLWYMDKYEIIEALSENPSLIILLPSHYALNVNQTNCAFSFERITENSKSHIRRQLIPLDLYNGMSLLGKEVHDMWCNTLCASYKQFAALGVLDDLLQAEENHVLAYVTSSIRNGETENNAIAYARLLYVGVS